MQTLCNKAMKMTHITWQGYLLHQKHNNPNRLCHSDLLQYPIVTNSYNLVCLYSVGSRNAPDE